MMKETYGHGRSQSSVPLLPYAETSPPSTPSTPAFLTKGGSFLHARRKSAALLCAFASVVSLGVLASFAVRGTSIRLQAPQALDSPIQDPLESSVNGSLIEVHANETALPPEPEFDYSPYVVGPPTQSFRDNLRNDTQYITSWLSAGWSAYNSIGPCSLS
jgi:hypothetical protein